MTDPAYDFVVSIGPQAAPINPWDRQRPRRPAGSAQRKAPVALARWDRALPGAQCAQARWDSPYPRAQCSLDWADSAPSRWDRAFPWAERPQARWDRAPARALREILRKLRPEHGSGIGRLLRRAGRDTKDHQGHGRGQYPLMSLASLESFGSLVSLMSAGASRERVSLTRPCRPPGCCVPDRPGRRT